MKPVLVVGQALYFVGLLILLWFGINHLTEVRFDYHSTGRDMLFAVVELAIPWGLMLIFIYQHRLETWDRK